MKMFYAVCKKIPVIDDIEDSNSYTLGKHYTFRHIEPVYLDRDGDWLITQCTDNTGVLHRMSFQYFNEFFMYVEDEVMV